MYILVKQEISNGFEHIPEITTFAHFDSAYEIYQDTIKSIAKDFDGCTPITNYRSDKEMSIFFDEENMKGNGVFVLLIEDETAVSRIMKAIDESKEDYLYDYLGDSKHRIRYSVPAKYINSNAILKLSDDMRGRVMYIIRRPSNGEDRFCTDYIYDVYCKTTDHSIYVESLETISVEALIDIVLNIL
jgi:hypothetical protein